MKHTSDSYEWKWCHVCGDCFIRDNWVTIISRRHTNSREVLSVGEPKPRGHIQQDLFLLWKVFSMERHTHQGGTKTVKSTSHSPSQGILLLTVCRPREAESGWGTGQYCCAQSTSFPPQVINPKTLWPQANYEAANHPSTPCLPHPALMTCPNNFHVVTFCTKIFQSPWKCPDRQKHGS